MYSTKQQTGATSLPTQSQDNIVYDAPFQVTKILPSAESITKKNDVTNEVTWDLTIVDRVDNRTEDDVSDINWFNSGLAFRVPSGYHIQVVGNSDLYQMGYFMPHPIIIGPNDTDQLLIPLFKFKEGDDLQLPFRCAHISLIKTIHARSAMSMKKSAVVRPSMAQYDDDDEADFRAKLKTPINIKKTAPRRQNKMF